MQKRDQLFVFLFAALLSAWSVVACGGDSPADAPPDAAPLGSDTGAGEVDAARGAESGASDASPAGSDAGSGTDAAALFPAAPEGVAVRSGSTVSTLAGSGTFADGVGVAASFYQPTGAAVDAAGNVYVADLTNQRIRKVTPAGVVTTLAGSDQISFGPGSGFYQPSGVAVDAAGNVYVAEAGNHRIRKVTPAGVVTTLAGSSAMESGFVDGTGGAARFAEPRGVAVDATGNVYVADTNNNRIRVVTPAGVVTTLAGGSAIGGFADGTGTAARFNGPRAIALDAAGVAYVGDNCRIRKVTSGGVVTTLAGSSTCGWVDATGTDANFKSAWGVAVDAAGNVFVADTFNHRIRVVTPAGVVTTLAGSGSAAFADGTGNAASFKYPWGVAADPAGNVYVADTDNHRIRAVTPAGEVTTLAGSGTPNWADGTGASASFLFPQGIILDAAGNAYVADTSNNRIRIVTPAGVVTTLAGSGAFAFADGAGEAASFNQPTGVALDTAGNAYVADQKNNRIRKVTPAGDVTTFAGSGTAGNVDGTGTAARFNGPWGVAIDGAGNVYVADTLNNRIRAISPGGVVTTLAGSGAPSFADGTGTAARFYEPSGLAMDAAGNNIYVADKRNNRIRKVTLAGVVTTLASPLGSFNWPLGVAVDAAGDVYVADTDNHRISRVTPAGVVTLFAGSGTPLFADGTNAVAGFAAPSGIALDAVKNVYVADSGTRRIRKIAALSGQIEVTWVKPNYTGSSAIGGYTASAIAAGQTTRTCTANGATTACTITGMTSAVTYSISVVAANATLSSAPSASVSATPN